MINTLFCDIADKLKLTGYFDTVYEYTEIIQRTDGTLRPMYYKGLKAGYIDVQNFDKNGTAYIRKRGTTTIRTDSSAIRLNSCVDTSKNILATFPLRLVVAVPKSQLEDSPMVDDVLAAELIGELQGEMQATATAMLVAMGSAVRLFLAVDLWQFWVVSSLVLVSRSVISSMSPAYTTDLVRRRFLGRALPLGGDHELGIQRNRICRSRVCSR